MGQTVVSPCQGTSNKYGHFDTKTSEFIVTDVLTPRPWVNVMSNGTYGLVVSQLGGGFSWSGNSQLNRLTRWEQDLALDQYGRWVYIVDRATGEVFSTTFAPVRTRAVSERVRHGLGYTVFEREFGRFSTRHTVFVPAEGNCEHWLLEVTNSSDSALDLRLGTYAEWFLGSQGEWHREFHRLFVTTEASGNVLSAWKRPGLDEGTRERPAAVGKGYLAVDGLSTVEWFADKATFIGPAGRLDSPDALIDSSIEPQVTGRWDDPIAGLRSDFSLMPGESVKVAFTLGFAGSNDHVSPTPVGDIERQLAQTQNDIQAKRAMLEIRTGNESFDLMMNGWLPHQAETGRMHARSAYYQQGGAYGFRDQLQDSLCLLDSEPQKCLDQLLIQAGAMYDDGGVRHWWHPGTQVFHESRHSDTCLWLAYGVLEYLDETAYLPALAIEIGLLDRATQAHGLQSSLLDHCQRGINRALSRLSPRGLPLIDAGDWNDGLSHAGLDGKGESIWMGIFLFHILRRWVPYLERLGEQNLAHTYSDSADKLESAVNEHGWDGGWYIAGTNDNGEPFGSGLNSQGQIFLNPQTWATIAGLGSGDRQGRAMSEVKSRLIKDYGALLLSPAYADVDPYIGYITRYAPGLRENGGVYSHAATWAVRALAMSGDLDKSYELFLNLLPPNRSSNDADRYQAEPYVMPGNIDGPDSPFEGKGGWTWYTGSAAWMRRVGISDILGVKASYDGLTIAGSLPEGLDDVSLTRPFRGDTFRIRIVRGGTPGMTVDGEAWSGPIPASGEAKIRTVLVTVGC